MRYIIAIRYLCTTMYYTSKGLDDCWTCDRNYADRFTEEQITRILDNNLYPITYGTWVEKE